MDKSFPALSKDFLDPDGNYINARGGGMVFHESLYYWYGECRQEGPASQNAQICIYTIHSLNMIFMSDAT